MRYFIYFLANFMNLYSDEIINVNIWFHMLVDIIKSCNYLIYLYKIIVYNLSFYDKLRSIYINLYKI